MSEEKKVPTRPLPKLTELDTAEFWRGTKDKEFRYQNNMEGNFPNVFNTYENQDYIGPLLDIGYVHPGYTKITNGKGKVDFSEHTE